MKKWLGMLILVALVGGGWVLFSRSDDKITELQRQMDTLIDAGDPEGEVPKLESEIQSIESQKTFNGILLAFLTAGAVGVVFVVFVLPAWAGKMTQSVYDSGEEVERTRMHEARSLVAQGKFDEAIASFRKVAEEEPGNRVPWLEISKIQQQQFEDPQAAIGTLETALASREWAEEDRAFFLFRIADLSEEDADDRERAAVALRRVIAELPGTRHAANARARMGEWNMS